MRGLEEIRQANDDHTEYEYRIAVKDGDNAKQTAIEAQNPWMKGRFEKIVGEQTATL